MLDKNGFKRKTYSDLLNDMSAKALELFGANAKVTEKSLLGILIRIMAWFLSLAWMAIEQVYHAGYRKSAEGINLDKLLPLAGTERVLADFAYGEEEFTGTPGYTVEGGTLVSKGDLQFITLADVTLDQYGKGIVDIMCTELGPIGNVSAHSINQLVNTNADITSVTNPSATAGGRDKEDDQTARERSKITSEGMGSGTTASIRAELLKIPSIRAAKVIENYEDTVDQYGTPSRAFQTFVLGGQDEEIAQAILNKKAGGIRPHGETYVLVPDLSGDMKKIGFTRASTVNLLSRVTLSKDNSFPADGSEQVKNTLVKYVGGSDTFNQLQSGLNMGEKVVVAMAATKIAIEVSGITDILVEFSLDGVSYSSDNVSINPNEVAQLNSSDIEVVINV